MKYKSPVNFGSYLPKLGFLLQITDSLLVTGQQASCLLRFHVIAKGGKTTGMSVDGPGLPFSLLMLSHNALAETGSSVPTGEGLYKSYWPKKSTGASS